MPAVMPSQMTATQFAPVTVRFDDAPLTAHLSMSSLGSTPRSTQDAYANYSRAQIYKKINHWFTEWQPWQQRMLLCGLTNRCSTNQLESIATTIEPLFHRDFVTSLRKRYPSAPFKKRDKRKERKELEALARELAEEILETAIKEAIARDPECAEGVEGENLEIDNVEAVLAANGDTENLQIETDELGNIQGISVPVPVEGTDENTTAVPEREGIVNQTIKEVDENETESKSETENKIENENKTETETETKPGWEAEPEGNREKSAEGEADEIDGGIKLGDEAATTIEGENVPTEGMIEDELEEITALDNESEFGFSTKSKQKYDSPRMIHISRPFLTSFQYAPRPIQDDGEGPQVYKDNLGLLLTRQHTSITNQQHQRQSYPPVAPSSGTGSRVHRHRSGVSTANIHATDFFDKGKITRLGPLQAQLRTGTVRRPARVTDLNAPVQKMYKHVKFWDVNPKDGKAFIKPKKSHLKWHFKEQVNRIWQWMDSWEDYEKLNLLVEVVKLCEQELLNYLAQCLIERLRERIDISWLSDPLLILIFSYLPEPDINACSRVCRRWRYLSSCNELWMIKSQEFGLDQGIPNILDLVRGAGKRGQVVDWRLAYMELKVITEQARSSLPLPSRLGFQGSTPVGMKRVGGKFIPASEPGALSRVQSHKTRTTTDSRLTGAGRHHTAATSRRHLILREPEHGSECKPETPSDSVFLDGLESVYECTSALPPESSFPSRGVSRFQSEMSPVKSERLMASREEARAGSKISKRGKKNQRLPQPLETPTAHGPLRQLRGRRKGADEEEDVALDIRPELVQAKDLLSKGATIPPKSWTAEEAKEARERLETYASKAEPVRRVRKLQGHMDAVLSIEFDHRRLISGSMDRSIRIWDIRSGRSLHKLLGHKGGVTCLCFDNERLYSGSWDTSVMVWDMVTFERIEVLTGHKGSISCIAMNDTYMLSGSHDHTVHVWLRTSLECEHVLDSHSSHVMCMALQGPHVITGSSDRSIHITNFLTGDCERVIKTTFPVNTLWLTGGLILTGNANGELHVINKKTGDAEVAIRAHEMPITCVTFHSNHIFTASADSTIKEWDLMTMACVRSLQGHKGAVKDFKISTKSMVSGGADGHVRVWDKVLPMFTNPENDDQIRMEVIDHTGMV